MKIRVFITAFFLFVLPISLAFAQQVELIEVEGKVHFRSDESSRWTKASAGVQLGRDAEVKIGSRGKCIVAFDQNKTNIITLHKNTRIKVDSILPGEVFLDKGRVFTLIRNIEQVQDFKVKTPTAVTGARGTGWVTEFEDGETHVSVFEDNVFVGGLDEDGFVVSQAEIAEDFRTSVVEGGQQQAPEPIPEVERVEMQVEVKQMQVIVEEFGPQGSVAPARTQLRPKGPTPQEEQMMQSMIANMKASGQFSEQQIQDLLAKMEGGFEGLSPEEQQNMMMLMQQFGPEGAISPGMMPTGMAPGMMPGGPGMVPPSSEDMQRMADDLRAAGYSEEQIAKMMDDMQEFGIGGPGMMPGMQPGTMPMGGPPTAADAERMMAEMIANGLTPEEAQQRVEMIMDNDGGMDPAMMGMMPGMGPDGHGGHGGPPSPEDVDRMMAEMIANGMSPEQAQEAVAMIMDHDGDGTAAGNQGNFAGGANQFSPDGAVMLSSGNLGQGEFVSDGMNALPGSGIYSAGDGGFPPPGSGGFPGDGGFPPPGSGGFPGDGGFPPPGSGGFPGDGGFPPPGSGGFPGDGGFPDDGHVNPDVGAYLDDMPYEPGFIPEYAHDDGWGPEDDPFFGEHDDNWDDFPFDPYNLEGEQLQAFIDFLQQECPCPNDCSYVPPECVAPPL